MDQDRPSHKEEITRLYNRVAEDFDKVGPETFSIFGRILVDEAHLKPGMRVIDIASGRGASLFPAARVVGKTGLVVGIDLAWKMVKLTHQNAQADDITPVNMLCMDAEKLAFPPAAFDALLCGFAIFFLNADASLREWKRVLKPGGKALISISAGNDPRWLWYEDMLQSYHHRYGIPLQSGGCGLNQPQDIGQALENKGFTDIEIHNHQMVIRYPDVETWWRAKWTHGSRYPLDNMPPDILERFEKDVLNSARQMELSEIRQLACILATRS